MGSNQDNSAPMALKTMRPQRGGISESSTTSDNTTDFIEIVKRHDVVYNTHHPDYKNVEIKLKVWNKIAKEIGLSVDASKRKWKNLRDSYTKYLRSFRVGSKTSKKYQFWAHAEHMEFLKPYQGPGRSNNGIVVQKDDDDTECDLGYRISLGLTKATSSNSTDDDIKQSIQSSSTNALSLATTLTNCLSSFSGVTAGGLTTSTLGLSTPTSAGYTTSGAIVLPVPSLPTVQLPPSLTAKPILGGMPNSCTPSSSGISLALSTTTSSSSNSTNHLPSSLASMSTSSMPSQVFAMPQLSAKGPMMPASNTASSVGCLIIEPQLFASADTFKKEFGNVSSSSSTTCTTQITPSNLHIYPNISAQVTPAAVSAANAAANRLNPPLITKIRRVQPSPHQTSSAINLSFSSSPTVSSAASLSSLGYNTTNGYFSTTAPNHLIPNFGANFGANLGATTTITSSANNGPTPAKRHKTAELEISAILQANRDLDANTLFFLSLARSVRSMPTKFQSLAKMRCMRIVSDIELELDNLSSDSPDANGHITKYCTNNADSPPPSVGSNMNEPGQSEHFVYVMSPSRVESMIDLSSDDENTQNPIASVSGSGVPGVGNLPGSGNLAGSGNVAIGGGN